MVNIFINNTSLVVQEQEGSFAHGIAVDVNQVKTTDVLKVLYYKIRLCLKERLKEWAKYLEILYRI